MADKEPTTSAEKTTALGKLVKECVALANDAALYKKYRERKDFATAANHREKAERHGALIIEIGGLLGEKPPGKGEIQADPNTLIGNETPLSLALRHNDTALLNELLAINPPGTDLPVPERATNVNAPNQNGETPLHIATRMGNTEMVKLLLTRKANPNAADKLGDTPLHHARGDIADLLIAAKAKLDAQNAKGETPLHKVVEMRRDREQQGKLPDATRLLEAGANPNIQDKKGDTPLHHAAKRDDEGIVKELLRFEAKLLANKEKRTPDAIAFAKRCESLFREKITVEKLVKIARMKEGSAALFAAAGGEDIEGIDSVKALKILLDNGANVNAADDNEQGWTALHKAAEKGDITVVKLLLQKGANAKAVNKGFNKSVLDIAARHGHLDVMKLLLEKGADPKAFTPFYKESVLHEAAGSRNVEAVKLLLEKGADAKAVDDSGTSILHKAADTGTAETVKLLLEKGADAKATNKSGYTCLHYAAGQGNLQIVKLLLEKGANPKAVTKRSISVLHEAACSLKANVEVVKLLLDRGAVSAKNDFGETPVEAMNTRQIDENIKSKIKELIEKHSKKTSHLTPPAPDMQKSLDEFRAGSTQVTSNASIPTLGGKEQGLSL